MKEYLPSATNPHFRGKQKFFLFLTFVLCLFYNSFVHAALVSSPSSVNFGNVAVNSSVSRSIIIAIDSSNSYASTVVITASGTGFSQTNNCPPDMHTDGNSPCTVTAVFRPTSTGTFSGQINIQYIDGATSGIPVTLTVPLSGTGIKAGLSTSPTSLNFPDTAINTTSAVQLVTVTNYGNAGASISNITTSGDFTQENNCPASLAATETCTVQVAFAPSVAGTRTGSLTISGIDTASQTSISASTALTGFGADLAISISPSTVDFGGVVVGSTSDTQIITITNTSNVAITLGSISVTDPFSQTNDCGTTLAIGSSCTINLSYTPVSTDSTSGTLTIAAQTADGAILVTELAVLTGSPIDVIGTLMSYAGDNPSLQSLVNVIVDTCASGRASARLQADCDAVIQAAIDGDASTALALAEILPERSIKSSRLMQQGGQVQASNVASRIAALRGGATGVSIGGLSFQINGKTMTGEQLASLVRAGDTGGSAGTEESIFGSRLGGFITGTLVSGDKSGTELDSGLDFKTRGITGGLDYRFTENLVLGGAVGYMKTDTDLDNDGGYVDSKGISLTAYGTYYTEKGYFVDFSAGYGRNNFDQSRHLGFDLTTQGVVDQDATADYDGKMLTLSLSSGYDFAVNGWTLGPRGSLDYIKTKVDGFAETLSNPTSDGGGWASFINETDQKWLTLRLGGKASYALSTNWGVLSPYAGIDWLHEFKNDSQIITGGLLEDPGSTLFSVYTDEPDRNYFQLNLGVSAVFKNGLIGYLNYDTILANDRWDRQSVNLGIRKEF